MYIDKPSVTKIEAADRVNLLHSTILHSTILLLHSTGLNSGIMKSWSNACIFA